jgi:hypothetical protein
MRISNYRKNIFLNVWYGEVRKEGRNKNRTIFTGKN